VVPELAEGLRERGSSGDGGRLRFKKTFMQRYQLIINLCMHPIDLIRIFVD
jgi:hypothetical protein